MKTNLDSLFKTDTKMEKDGIDFEVGTSKFRLSRFGGMNSPQVKAKMALYYKPHARAVENDTLSVEKENEILAKVFVKSCLKGWTNVVIDGQEAPYSEEVAIKLFTALPELLKKLMSYASDPKNFLEEFTDTAELGNS